MRFLRSIAKCDAVEGDFQMANRKNQKREVKDFMIRVRVTTEEQKSSRKGLSFCKRIYTFLDHRRPDYEVEIAAVR